MFPITMSFTVSTPAELAKLVAATGTQISVDAPQGVKKPKEGTTEPKDGGPEAKPAASAAEKATYDPKPQPAEAASAAPPAATQATPEPTAAASGAETTLDYDKDVKPAFLKLVQTKGRAAGRKIIDAFAPTKEKLSEAITTQEQYRQALDLIAKYDQALDLIAKEPA